MSFVFQRDETSGGNFDPECFLWVRDLDFEDSGTRWEVSIRGWLISLDPSGRRTSRREKYETRSGSMTPGWSDSEP